MEKFVRVECIEAEKMTKKEFMKKMLGERRGFAGRRLSYQR